MSIWLRAWQQSEQATTSLICMPHAGGSASFFRDWRDELPAGIELLAAQYPGREDRFNEPACISLVDMAQHISDALLARPVRSLLLFGHSMGAAVAYEVGLRLEAAGRPAARLFVSAHPPPHRQRRSDLHRQSDQALIDDICRQASDTAHLWQNADLRRLFLPVLRSDYQAIETWRSNAQSLSTSIDVLLARDDREVSAEEALAWHDLTEADASLHWFDGDHFYLKHQPGKVVRHLLRQIAPTRGTGS
nr:alpha/beta fold hydrolase [Pseudomonas sp. PA27(2017)]